MNLDHPAASWVFDFDQGSREMRELLGGKGANIAEMTRVLGPERVPAGFTITTEACVAYMRGGEQPPGLDEQVDEALARLEERVGKRLGDPEDPLLVSVRSGARVSMPGMLDTVLNLGLNEGSTAGLAAAHGQRALRLRLATPLRADVRRRGAGDPGLALRGRRCGRREQRKGVDEDTGLDAEDLRDLTASFERIFTERDR